MATPHRLRHHVGVFRSVPAYMHEAMVAAYVRDATFAPMDDETLASYVAPWLAGRFEKHRTGLGLGAGVNVSFVGVAAIGRETRTKQELPHATYRIGVGEKGARGR